MKTRIWWLVMLSGMVLCACETKKQEMQERPHTHSTASDSTVVKDFSELSDSMQRQSVQSFTATVSGENILAEEWEAMQRRAERKIRIVRDGSDPNDTSTEWQWIPVEVSSDCDSVTIYFRVERPLGEYTRALPAIGAPQKGDILRSIDDFYIWASPAVSRYLDSLKSVNKP